MFRFQGFGIKMVIVPNFFGIMILSIRDKMLAHLLPQMRPEDLDEGDLERGNLSVHENSS